ncbi:ribonucleoside-diphosphate reductase, adenosylcobalamin-dependent [archaeon]|nr:ribonucleoside-diphosphate reductase, adenosylcobalamin-dependent [archaeon]
METSLKTVQHVIKRDGRTVPFHPEKIAEAIFKAAQTVGGNDRQMASDLAADVAKDIAENHPKDTPTVEEVQDAVERVLINLGHAKTAKAFILYRHKRKQDRVRRALILGEEHADDNLDFTQEALKILEQRYLQKDELGRLIEDPRQMILRVASAIADADKKYNKNEEDVRQLKMRFFDLIASRKFFPATPTLMNAGTKNQQLHACYVLPVKDDMESIFGTLHDAAVIHQQGGGTGFSFTRLRPKRDPVQHHLGVAPGPVSFLRVYDRALDVIKQGGVRPGANMAVMRVDHPDIIRFIEAKRDKMSLKNFNISVAVTDNFMRAVEEDREYYVKNPRTEKFVGKLRARDVFAVITQNAWKTGDPGLIYLDEINRKHPGKHLGDIETTNQCGELPLLPYEGCALGSIDVAKYIKGNDLDWQQLEEDVKTATYFLDNVIDVNKYPRREIKVATLATRKLGLGIMGFADMLFSLGIRYDSEEGLVMGDKLMSFVKKVAYTESQRLASERGPCEAWKGSDHEKAGRIMRNMTCISLSPTGTRSILADTSPGCEPVFAVSYRRTVLTSSELVFVNKVFERVAKERGFYSPELIRKVSMRGGVQSIKDIPKDVRDVFVTAQDIKPEWHIRMQATLQKHVDNSISKTINFPRTAAIKDVENVYLQAWKAKCKGITIYRDGSYEDQVISIGEGM